jgi:hypothetical protein
MALLSYRRHRFPASIIQHAIWLYLRFTLRISSPNVGRTFPTKRDRMVPGSYDVHHRCSCAAWELSRMPSVKPMSSFLPSGVAPMMTRMHCACCSSRASKWMPSAQQ